MAAGGLERMYLTRGGGELLHMADLFAATRGEVAADGAPLAPAAEGGAGGAMSAELTAAEVSVASLGGWSLPAAVQVFDGDFTDAADKVALVEPVLGLWASAPLPPAAPRPGAAAAMVSAAAVQHSL